MPTSSSSKRWLWKSWTELTVPELYALLKLRQQVFVVEQDCPYLDADGLDPKAHHLLGLDRHGLFATLRGFGPGILRPEQVIGRVVVAPTHRGAGWGRELMIQGQRALRHTHGPGPIWLSAQAHLEPFYSQLGYARCGEGYLEDNIPHLPMRLPPEAPQQP